MLSLSVDFPFTIQNTRGMDTSAQSPVSVSTPTSQSVQIPPDKSSLSRARLILFGLLGIALLSIVGGGAYVLGINATKKAPVTVKVASNIQASPTTDPTAKWKVYKNNLYEFKYPQNWYLQDTSTGQFFYTSQQDEAAAAPSSKFSVTTDDKNLLKITSADPIGTKKEIGDKIFETKISTVSVGSHPAFKVKTEVQAGSQTDALPGWTVVIDMGSNILNLDITGSTDADNKLLDQILSTFKFTDSSASADMSGWKTYMSIIHSFSLKYPSNWEAYEHDGEIFFRPKSEDGAAISIDIFSNQSTTLKLVTDGVKNYWDERQVGTVNISGITATEVSGIEKGKKNAVVVFEYGDNIYRMQTLGDHADVFNQILSTFTFTK